MRKNIIAASILSADLGCLAQEAAMVLRAGADWLHIDVMDNHYVPNLTFGPLVCQALRRHLASAFLDVHLMIKPVDALIDAFAAAGANQISFHPDASDDFKQNLRHIQQLGCKAGLAINPKTSLRYLQSVWNQLDFLLIMSVNPGFAGQAFMPEVIHKISAAKQLIQRYSPHVRLGVDGGIKQDNIIDAANAGADTFVVGSGIFKSANYTEALLQLKSALYDKGK